MTDETYPSAVWQRLPELSDAELRALVEATMSVLRSEAGTIVDVDPATPPKRLRRDLRQALDEEGLAAEDTVVERLVGDDRTSREIAIAILASISEHPLLRQEIERVYQERTKMMFLDAGVLTGAALLLLVVKLKHVKINKGGLDVAFYEASNTAIEKVLRILRGG